MQKKETWKNISTGNICYKYFNMPDRIADFSMLQ